MKGLASIALSSSGFNGLTNFDQRNSNHGNQFNVEPPNPSIAVGNGYVLQGVNNAVQVYTTAGVAMLPTTVASNQLFNVSAAIDRSTGFQGVYPTDMRVFYDPGINRWFVLQRSQDNDSDGNPLNSSHVYMAVSATGDPTGVYNIYTIDTTNAVNPNCPCFSDYIQVGADQYGFYISANEYNTFFNQSVDTTIWVISKNGLASGAATPATARVAMGNSTGYEFSIQPAAVPPGGSNFIASGGIEFFLSTQSSFSFDTNVALWAMSNTASINAPQPSLTLTRILVPTEAYVFPDIATQQPGPTPYGTSLFQPLETIDGNPDSRMLSVVYAGGRLYGTFATEIVDSSTNRSAVGGAYVIISPGVSQWTTNRASVAPGLYRDGGTACTPSCCCGECGRQGRDRIQRLRSGYLSERRVPADRRGHHGIHRADRGVRFRAGRWFFGLRKFRSGALGRLFNRRHGGGWKRLDHHRIHSQSPANPDSELGNFRDAHRTVTRGQARRPRQTITRAFPPEDSALYGVLGPGGMPKARFQCP